MTPMLTTSTSIWQLKLTLSTFFAIFLVMKQSNPAYHHGDLRAALLKTATEMIAEQGMESLTLRALSKRIGVSRTAPYRHFSDKSALLAVVAEEGFKRLYHKMQAAMKPAEGNIALQFQKMGVAYVQYAVENPTHYRLMFSCEAESQAQDPAIGTAGESVFDLLVETIRKGQAQAQFKPGESLDLAYVAWSAVHGLAILIVDAQIHSEFDMEALTLLTTQTVVEGMRLR